MPQALRNTLLSLRDLALTFGPFLLLAAGLLGSTPVANTTLCGGVGFNTT